MEKPIKTEKGLGYPLAILAVIILSLLIVFGVVTYRSIRQQESEYIRLTTMKGESLIRSVEAGARFGMRMTAWGEQRLQQLLLETGQQPDIEYIFIIDESGRVVAHSNSEERGSNIPEAEIYMEEKDQSRTRYRFTHGGKNADVFEVYRQFVPSRNGHRGMMRGEITKRFRDRGITETLDSVQGIIVVGFNINEEKTAHLAARFNAIFSGVLLFVVASAGLVLLFVYQNYRSTKSSLSKVQAFSDHLVENMPIGLIAIDGEGRLTSLNASAENLIGNSDKTVIGKSASAYLPVDIWHWIQENKNSEGLIEGEISCQQTGGESVPIEISLSKIPSAGGEVSGFIILTKDLTEIQALRKEVVRSQRMASLGRLAAGIAHEIRNPLSSIKGFATYFKTRYKDIPKDVNIADIMIQETERLNRSVSQLLELSKPIVIQPIPNDLNRLLEDSIKLVEEKAMEANVSINYHRASGDTMVKMDKDRVSQVLLNLYLNAIESMEGGGVLTIRTDLDQSKKMISISISDTGAGISEEVLSKIYDPYFTTKNTGTGLGLAVVYNIIEAYGGRIDATSQAGQGTTFNIQIPIKG